MKKIGIALLVFAVVLAVSACQRNNNGAPDQTTAPAASPTGSPAAGTPPPSPSGTASTSGVDAQSVYAKSCIACHAADMSGGVGPNLQKVGARLSTDEISARIHNGGGGMPAFKGTLTEDQINALVNWLSAKKG